MCLIEKKSSSVGRNLIVSIVFGVLSSNNLDITRRLFFSYFWSCGLHAGYDIEKIDHFPSQPVNTTHVPPAFAVVPGNDNAEKSHERTTTTRQSSFASSVYQTCYLNLINCFLASVILLLL